eukprot:jgi/Botrbrau1/8919/Bobra.0148s0032.2
MLPLARAGSRSSTDSLDSLDNFLAEFDVVESEEDGKRQQPGRPAVSPLLSSPFLPMGLRQQATPTRASTNSYRTFRAANKQAAGAAAKELSLSSPESSGRTPTHQASSSGRPHAAPVPPFPNQATPSPRQQPPREPVSDTMVLQTFSRMLDRDLGRRDAPTSSPSPVQRPSPVSYPTVPSDSAVPARSTTRAAAPLADETVNPLMLFVPQTPEVDQSLAVATAVARGGVPSQTDTTVPPFAPLQDSFTLSFALGRMPSEEESGNSSPLAPLDLLGPFQQGVSNSPGDCTASVRGTVEVGRGSPPSATPVALARAPVTSAGPSLRLDREPFVLVQRPALSVRSLSPLHSGEMLQLAGPLAKQGLRKRDFESELLDRLLNDGRAPAVAGPAKSAAAEASGTGRTVALRSRDPCFGAGTNCIMLVTTIFALIGTFLFVIYTGRQHVSRNLRVGGLPGTFFEAHTGMAAAHSGAEMAHHHMAMQAAGGAASDTLHRDMLPLGLEDSKPMGAHERDHVDHDRERERSAAAGSVPHQPADAPHHHLPSKPGLRLLMQFRGPHILLSVR